MDASAGLPETRRVPVPFILIVDDDPSIREALEEYVEQLGYRAAVAADGAEGLRCLERGPRPDLVLLDLNMPRVDGEALASRVRASATLSEVPIVVMSASTRRLSPRLATDHLEKPFGFAQLDAVLGRFCVQS